MVDKQSSDKILVKINGKKQEATLSKKQNNKKTFSWVLPETEKEISATAEESNIVPLKKVDRYKQERNKKLIKRKSSLPPGKKPFWFKIVGIVACACLVGIGLGLFSVNMLTATEEKTPKQEKIAQAKEGKDSEPKESVSSNSEEKKTEQKEQKKSSFTIKLDAFIVQAGVFSTKEAAEKEGRKLSVPVEVIKQNDKFTLIAGISPTLSEARALGKRIEEQGVSVYAKKYEGDLQAKDIADKDGEHLAMLLQTAIVQSSKAVEGEEVEQEALKELKTQLGTLSKKDDLKEYTTSLSSLEKSIEVPLTKEGGEGMQKNLLKVIAKLS